MWLSPLEVASPRYGDCSTLAWRAYYPRYASLRGARVILRVAPTQISVLPTGIQVGGSRRLGPPLSRGASAVSNQAPLRLMAILAHPDDESLGNSATLARYAAEGVEITLVTATRGQRGWLGEPTANPGPEALGRTREAELLAAGAALGLREVVVLDYLDGELDQAEPDQIICELVAHIRRVRPQVVLTWGPDGGYGHPDHIAIGQFATAAVMRAADPRYGHI